MDLLSTAALSLKDYHVAAHAFKSIIAFLQGNKQTELLGKTRPSRELKRRVSGVFIQLALTLLELGDYNRCVVICDSLLSSSSSSSSTSSSSTSSSSSSTSSPVSTSQQQLTVVALTYKADALLSLGSPKDALACLDEAIELLLSLTSSLQSTHTPPPSIDTPLTREQLILVSTLFESTIDHFEFGLDVETLMFWRQTDRSQTPIRSL
eukprot:TRINITY_DN2022_c0_g1_i3.p1 TRINITY_DN2022_c0_g1~~TRINITY_DN2022_c0_g1_i3.p1  ORF type:complete len:208 (-),score=72.20 TRINITY_DN2022_c0_g1_i3:418-1041(-)